MPFPSVALTTAQQEALRGTASVNPTWRGSQNLSLCPNTAVVSCRINGTPTGKSFAQFIYDGVTTGAIANVKIGQTVLISRDNDRRNAYFSGRIRAAPTGSSSGIIYINENSAALQDNDYVFILEDYRIWPKLARDVSGTHYKDWDKAFAQLPPVVIGVQTAYAGFISVSSSKLRIAFNASSSYAATSGATISSYAWTFPGSASVVSGATNTAVVTIDFAESAGDWCSLLVTDSGGRTQTRRFHVWAHGDTYPPATGFDGASITGDITNGWNGNVRAFTGVDSVLDNTLVCVWTQEWYNGTEGAVLAGTNDPRNVNLVGRLRRESNQGQSDEQYSYVADVSFEIEGPAAQLSRLHGALITTLFNTSPTVWDEINNLTPWRVIVHLLAEHSTFLTLHDLTFDSVTTTFLSRGITTQGQNLLEVANDVAQSINAALEFAPTGEAQVIRDARYISTTARNALTTIAALGTQDYLTLTLSIDHVLTTGRVDGSGGTFNSTTGETTPFLSIAPGEAQDYPEASSTLTRQILQADVDQSVAQDELNERIGRAFAVSNGTANLNITHLDGYAFLAPSRRYWFTWALSTSENIRGRAFTSSQRWLLQNVSITHDNATGTRTVQAEYLEDISDTTLGAAGDTVTYPAEGEIPLNLPNIPPFDVYGSFPDLPLWLDDNPAPGDAPPLSTGGTAGTRDGNTVMIWDDQGFVWIARNVLQTSNPTWMDVTPPATISIRHCIFDQTANSKAAYVLANDGTSSFVYATTDIFASPVVWTRSGADYGGIYTKICPIDVAGSYMIYAPGGLGGTWEKTFDFTVDNGGFTANTYGEYLVGVGWNGTQISGTAISINISRSTPNGTYTGAELDVTSNLTIGNFAAAIDATTLWADSIPTTQTYTWSGSLTNPSAIAFNPSGQPASATLKITRLKLSGTGANPFGGGGGSNAEVRVSTDYCASFGSAVVVGTAPGTVGGFDTIRVGTASIAASDAQVKRASTVGGAYGNATDGATAGTDPYCIVVPWYTKNSTSAKNYSTADPEYIISTPATFSSKSLIWITTTQQDITPVISANPGLAVGDNCVTTWKGTHLAAILSFGGTRKLVTSINGGTAWTDRGGSGVDSSYIRLLRLQGTAKLFFFVSGDALEVSRDWGVTTAGKTTPTAGTLLGCEPYG